ncbi:MAG: carotenoid biosynthesis protein [Actinobacteria bacterium]|nr:carotenoid biosynthesis protein [Actinomycetota bacterium]MCB9414732.1 carotenoid biosynthesis protein [Actinomycetota bacterium]MCB9424381.1 carotenoid biosynthesis protein [Actinomycetota bacterium]
MVTDAGPRHRVAAVPWLFAGAAVLAQITWILVPAGDRELVTSAVVLLFTAASLSHAWQQFGAGWAVRFAVVSAVFGLAIELLGHTTDIPFGPYDYTDSLQPQILGVPVIVPLAWAMMAYPCLLLARFVTTRWVVPMAAVGLTTWDFFLDPQMVAEGYWVWERTAPALPGIPGIPLQNYLGWFLGSLLLMWAVNRLPRQQVNLGVPLLLYGWMWIGGIVANAVFLDRPSVALVGGIGMAALGVPALVTWWRR